MASKKKPIKKAVKKASKAKVVKKVVKKPIKKVVAKKAKVEKPKKSLSPAKNKKAQDQDRKATKLLHKGKERGFVTYDEILREFPTIEEDITFLDDLYSKLQTAGIDILEGGGLLEMQSDAIEPKAYSYGGRASDSSYDSIQMYLKEIGQYPLISAGSEKDLAKRISEGRKTDSLEDEILYDINIDITIDITINILSCTTKPYCHETIINNTIIKGCDIKQKNVEKIVFDEGYTIIKTVNGYNHNFNGRILLLLFEYRESIDRMSRAGNKYYNMFDVKTGFIMYGAITRNIFV